MNSPENNARLLRDIDLHIDHALAALRNAHPRAGLDRRILHALEERAPSTHRSHTALRLIPSLPLAAWVASGALALAILAALLLPHTHPAPPQLTTATPAAALPSRPEASYSHRDTATEQPAFRIAGSRVPHLRVQPYRALRWAGPSAPPANPSLTPEEAADLADLHAPSHPAPPLPLTPQEKALLRMLRRGNGVELASLADLNPTVRSARDAADAADFHAFFNPPLPTQPDGDTE